MAKTKWKYSVPNPDLIARAMSILYGENEQIMARKNTKFTPITPEPRGFLCRVTNEIYEILFITL